MVGAERGGCGPHVVDGECASSAYCLEGVAAAANAYTQVGKSPCFLGVRGHYVVCAWYEGVPIVFCAGQNFSSNRGECVYAPHEGVDRWAWVLLPVGVRQYDRDFRVVFEQ